MKIKIEQNTVAEIQIREKELGEIITSFLKDNGVNIDGQVAINFTTEAFSSNEDGMNAYDEDVVNIRISKNKIIK